MYIPGIYICSSGTDRSITLASGVTEQYSFYSPPLARSRRARYVPPWRHFSFPGRGHRNVFQPSARPSRPIPLRTYGSTELVRCVTRYCSSAKESCPVREKCPRRIAVFDRPSVDGAQCCSSSEFSRTSMTRGDETKGTTPVSAISSVGVVRTPYTRFVRTVERLKTRATITSCTLFVP